MSSVAVAELITVAPARFVDRNFLVADATTATATTSMTTAMTRGPETRGKRNRQADR